MGHTRLGNIPKSRKWSAVVAQIASTPIPGTAEETTQLIDFVAELSQRTLEAATAGLRHAAEDLGLRYTFFLLTQVALASRTNDWARIVKSFGIRLPENASIFDLTTELQTALDDHLLKQGHSSDISEMAQRAAGEAVSSLAGPESVTLFGSGRDELQNAIRQLSTKNGFGLLSQRFFARFMASFLNFYLSRVTASYLGGSRLQQVGDLSSFNEALLEHCEQSARVVRDFSAGWYSKTEFEQGINFQNTTRFVAVALEKIQAELFQQRKAL